MLMVALVLWVFDLLASLELLAFRHEMGGGAITSPCELVVCYHGKHHVCRYINHCIKMSIYTFLHCRKKCICAHWGPHLYDLCRIMDINTSPRMGYMYYYLLENWWCCAMGISKRWYSKCYKLWIFLMEVKGKKRSVLKYRIIFIFSLLSRISHFLSLFLSIFIQNIPLIIIIVITTTGIERIPVK